MPSAGLGTEPRRARRHDDHPGLPTDDPLPWPGRAEHRERAAGRRRGNEELEQAVAVPARLAVDGQVGFGGDECVGHGRAAWASRASAANHSTYIESIASP